MASSRTRFARAFKVSALRSLETGHSAREWPAYVRCESRVHPLYVEGWRHGDLRRWN